MKYATTYFDDVKVGDELPPLVKGPLHQIQLTRYAGASGDFNPIHQDHEFAKAAGMNDVFAHGMLSMAYLAQLLTRWVPQERLRSWNVRFTAITPLHATVRCTGEVTELFEAQGERRARLKIATHTDDGLKTLEGEAVVALA